MKKAICILSLAAMSGCTPQSPDPDTGTTSDTDDDQYALEVCITACEVGTSACADLKDPGPDCDFHVAAGACDCWAYCIETLTEQAAPDCPFTGG